MTEFEKIKNGAEIIEKRAGFVPEIAIVLGSGLGFFADRIDKVCEIPYSDFGHFPVSTVSGHAGKFIFGRLNNKKVALMSGRVHYYEGYDAAEAVRPIRTLCLAGAKKVILTNAAGGIAPDFVPGTLMLITDHISSFVPSPLRGKNVDELGTRFPDMSSVYSERMREVFRNSAKKLGIDLKSGVYLQFPGPQYETPAEIRMARTLGADAVGMSTAIEAISLNHMGAEICGISCITNLAAGIAKHKLTHEEVKETSERVSGEFASLITDALTNI